MTIHFYLIEDQFFIKKFRMNLKDESLYTFIYLFNKKKQLHTSIMKKKKKVVDNKEENYNPLNLTGVNKDGLEKLTINENVISELRKIDITLLEVY